MRKLRPFWLALLLATSLPVAPALARISTEYIRSVIRAHLPEIRECYEGGLRLRPDLAGRVVIRFTIAQDGSVPLAEVTQTTLHEPSVETCMVDRVLGFRFPPIPRAGPISVNYPFVFEPEPPTSPASPAH